MTSSKNIPKTRENLKPIGIGSISQANQLTAGSSYATTGQSAFKGRDLAKRSQGHIRCTTFYSGWRLVGIKLCACMSTCLAPSTTGTMHSGSVAWVLSSIRMERNCILARRGSPAPTQVQQITSAFWTTKMIYYNYYKTEE